MKTETYTPRDFIDVPDKNIYESADFFQEFINQMDKEEANAFDITTISPTGILSKAIDLFSQEPHLVEKLWENTNYARETLISNGFDTGKSVSPIIPIMVRDNMKAKTIARKLLERGIYIIPATYPAVKLKDSRLRMNVSAMHTKEDIDYFCQQLNAVEKEIPFKNN